MKARGVGGTNGVDILKYCFGIWRNGEKICDRQNYWCRGL